LNVQELHWATDHLPSPTKFEQQQQQQTISVIFEMNHPDTSSLQRTEKQKICRKFSPT